MVCRVCNEDKDIGLFTKNNSYCKKCDNIRAVEYRRSKIGKLTQVYNDQVKSSRKRGNCPPLYTKKEFIEYMLSSDEFNSIYKEWKDSGYNRQLSPSVDRLNEYVEYSFDNIQIVTWEENNRLAYERRKNGENNKQSKAVGRVVGGVVVDKYHSINKASRDFNIRASHISEVCYGKRKQAGGFKWIFISDKNDSKEFNNGNKG